MYFADFPSLRWEVITFDYSSLPKRLQLSLFIKTVQKNNHFALKAISMNYIAMYNVYAEIFIIYNIGKICDR